jgi:hypothetical protein
MKNSTWKTGLAIGIIILFLGTGVLPITASGDVWSNAQINGKICGLDQNDVSWFFPFPGFFGLKKIAFNFNFNSSVGNGQINITPRGQPMISYHFPEDFHQLYILLFVAPFGLGRLSFQYDPSDEDYDLDIFGRGYEVEIG